MLLCIFFPFIFAILLHRFTIEPIKQNYNDTKYHYQVWEEDDYTY